MSRPEPDASSGHPAADDPVALKAALGGVSSAFASLGRVFLCLDSAFHVLHASSQLDRMLGSGAARRAEGRPAADLLGTELFGPEGTMRQLLLAGERREGTPLQARRLRRRGEPRRRLPHRHRLRVLPRAGRIRQREKARGAVLPGRHGRLQGDVRRDRHRHARGHLPGVDGLARPLPRLPRAHLLGRAGRGGPSPRCRLRGGRLLPRNLDRLHRHRTAQFDEAVAVATFFGGRPRAAAGGETALADRPDLNPAAPAVVGSSLPAGAPAPAKKKRREVC